MPVPINRREREPNRQIRLGSGPKKLPSRPKAQANYFIPNEAAPGLFRRERLTLVSGSSKRMEVRCCIASRFSSPASLPLLIIKRARAVSLFPGLAREAEDYSKAKLLIYEF